MKKLKFLVKNLLNEDNKDKVMDFQTFKKASDRMLKKNKEAYSLLAEC